jgi:hypothetical protein
MGTEMDSMNRRNVKMYAAIFGGSAVVALGAISAAIVQQPAGQDSATGATVGAVTSTAPAPAGLVEESPDKAAPMITGTPAWPSGEVPNRIP